MYSLEATFVLEAFSNAVELWDSLSATHPCYKGCQMNVLRSESMISFDDYSDFLSKKNNLEIGVEFNEGSIYFSEIPSLGFARLDINNLVYSESDGEEWLGDLLNDDCFIQARLYNDEYDRWQNTENISLFEEFGMSMDALSFKSNGLPFPLEEKIIDISSNPGRWFLRQGYIESIGSVMWLGNQFWKRVRSEKAEFLKSSQFEIKEIKEHIKVKAQEVAFSSAKNTEADIQNQLRQALYQRL